MRPLRIRMMFEVKFGTRWGLGAGRFKRSATHKYHKDTAISSGTVGDR